MPIALRGVDTPIPGCTGGTPVRALGAGRPAALPGAFAISVFTLARRHRLLDPRTGAASSRSPFVCAAPSGPFIAVPSLGTPPACGASAPAAGAPSCASAGQVASVADNATIIMHIDLIATPPLRPRRNPVRPRGSPLPRGGGGRASRGTG